MIGHNAVSLLVYYLQFIKTGQIYEYIVGRATIDLIHEVVGLIATEVIRIFFFTSCGSLIPFTRANAQWFFYGFHLAL